MYNKLRYILLRQRAKSRTCETLAGQMILSRLERMDGAAEGIAEKWRVKRDDYASDPNCLAYLLLDFMYQQRTIPPLAHNGLSPRMQCMAAEFQRLWATVELNSQRVDVALPHELEQARAFTVLAALNAGAWLDNFLWRDANQATPINVF